MRQSGRARKAAFRIIWFCLLAILVIWIAGWIIVFAGLLGVVAGPLFFGALWLIFAVFTLYFFRDPNARPPTGPGLVLSTGHGKVDAIDTVNEPKFMGGECQRVSVFLSIFDIHVQNAPVAGKVVYLQYTEGEFLNALRAESAEHNENVLLGFEASDPAGQKVGVRLIAGVIARRIVPYVKVGDEVARGERISHIQFGSRADIYLPAGAKVKVKLGDHVKGGETVVAAFE
jgi:phosphatidylserine decarboxylase